MANHTARVLTTLVVVRSRSRCILGLLAATAIAASLTGCDKKIHYTSAPLGDAQRVTVSSKPGFDSDQQAVIDQIVALADATKSGNYAKVCKDLLTKSSVAQIKGPCPDWFQERAEFFSAGLFSIQDVKIKDKTATVDNLTRTSPGAKPNPAAFKLTKDDQGTWRFALFAQ